MKGSIYGLLTVLEEVSAVRGRKAWLCQCECGTKRIVLDTSLRSGNTKSCGCTRGKKNTKHGYAKKGKRSPAYSSWASMLNRCNNPDCKIYNSYGGRGIYVVSRWHDFTNFLADMGERPKGMSIDRIDNNGPYSPDNCRWATQKEQTNNTRKNVKITFGGKTLNLSQWSELTGIKYITLWNRIFRQEWPIELALTTKPKRGNRLKNLAND